MKKLIIICIILIPATAFAFGFFGFFDHHMMGEVTWEVFNVTDGGGEAFVVTDGAGEDFKVR